MTETDPEASLAPPSLRDRVNLDAVIRQQASQLVSLQPGMLGGRFPPAAPARSAGNEADEEPTGSGEEGDDSQVAWQWEDRYIAGSTGVQAVNLTYVPVEESLFVLWHPDGFGGVPVPRTWFTVVGNLVTITPPAGVLAPGDEFSFQYQFNPGDVLGSVPLAFLGATDNIDIWTIPPEAVDGGLLVAVAMVIDGKTPTLNGWTSLGESDLVTHAANSGTYTYRLVALATTYDSGTTVVPTIPSFGFDSVCLMAAFDATGTATGIFNTDPDSTVGTTAAITPSSLRVWGTIGNFVIPIPSRGVQIAFESGSDICLLMTLDGITTPASATVLSSAGWCMLAMRVEAAS